MRMEPSLETYHWMASLSAWLKLHMKQHKPHSTQPWSLYAGHIRWTWTSEYVMEGIHVITKCQLCETIINIFFKRNFLWA